MPKTIEGLKATNDAIAKEPGPGAPIPAVGEENDSDSFFNEEIEPPNENPAPPAPEPAVENPFAPRGYDLPADKASGEETTEVVFDVRDAIVSKAIDGAGLCYGEHRNAYTQFLFPAEYATNKIVAGKLAKYSSSCGVFARACYASAGASYYFNPASKKWPEQKESNGPANAYTVDPDPDSGDVGDAIGPQTVVQDYFTSAYKTGTVITAFYAIAKQRGALKYPKPDGKGMCKLKRGDILVVSNSEHVIVCVSDFDPAGPFKTGTHDPNGKFTPSENSGKQNPFFDAVEGGQQDLSNKLSEEDVKKKMCSYADKEGQNLSSAIMPTRVYWNGSAGSGKSRLGLKSTGGPLVHEKSYGTLHPARFDGCYVLSKDFSQQLGGGGVSFAGGLRRLMFVIDAEKFINKTSPSEKKAQ